jgi:Ni,Fe-hydrogenase III component G
MSEAENIKSAIENKFGPQPALTIQRPQRIWLEVEYRFFLDIFEFAVKQLDFSFLNTITGLDEDANLGFIYHLARTDGIILSLHTRAAKDTQAIKSVTPYFPAAAIYERELIDLLGAKIDDVPQGLRYPLPDDWPPKQYPLRKDWNAEVLNSVGGSRE